MASSILQFTASESFGFDDGRLKTADYSRESGFGLRGVSGEMTGFAHANDISAAAIRARARRSKLLDPDQGAPARAAAARTTATSIPTPSPLDLVPFAEKVALAARRSTPPPARAIRASSQVSASLSG